MFHVGQEVVCVDDAKAPTEFNGEYFIQDDLSGLSSGDIYTVRWVGLGFDDGGPFDGIKVAEIYRPKCEVTGLVDCPFGAHRFRPIVSKQLPECLTVEHILRQRESEPA